MLQRKVGISCDKDVILLSLIVMKQNWKSFKYNTMIVNVWVNDKRILITWSGHGTWENLHVEIMIEIYCYCSWDFYIFVSITSSKLFIQNKYIYEYT